MISYVIYYADGRQDVKHFTDKWELAAFIHDEAGNVSTVKRFFPEEQDEKDYIIEKSA